MSPHSGVTQLYELASEEWQDPATLPAGRIGAGPLRIAHRVLKQGRILAIYLEAPSSGSGPGVTFDGDVLFPVLLLETTRHWCRWPIIMCATPNEWLAHWPFLQRARGQILVAGLGVGMSVCWLVRQPQVEHLTVIEREPALIALLRPRLPEDRVTIMCGDFWAVARRLPRVFDAAWMDAWNLAEPRALREEGARAVALLRSRAVKPQGWVGAWAGTVQLSVWNAFTAGKIPAPYRSSTNQTPSTPGTRRISASSSPWTSSSR